MKPFLITARITRSTLAIATVVLVLGNLAGGCQSDPPVSATVSAAERAAQRSSARAARLDSAAHTLYQQAQAAADSATFYHLQSTHVQATTIDSAALQRYFADY